MNRSPDGNYWLILTPVGTKGNRDWLVARVELTPNVCGPQGNHATKVSGFSTSSDERIRLGRGAATGAEVETTWPSVLRQLLAKVKADQVLT